MGPGLNTTDPLAASVHGTNPQNLVEKITRMKVYSSLYWKEHCFGLTAETLVDRAMGLQYYGGTFGGLNKPSKFLCLILKMLQLQPEKDIIVEFIKNTDFKYVRVLGAFYLRLVGKPVDIYKYLELLYSDYRKIRHRTNQGWEVIRIDEFIDQLLTSDYACDIALPRLPKRWHLEDVNMLPPRVTFAEDDDEDEEKEEADEEKEEADAGEGPDETSKDTQDGEKSSHGDRNDLKEDTVRGDEPKQAKEETPHKSRSPDRRRERDYRRSRSPDRRRERDYRRSRSPDRRRERDYRRSRSPDRRRERDYRRSRSPDRRRERDYRRSRSPDRRRRSRSNERRSRKRRSRSRSSSRDRSNSQDNVLAEKKYEKEADFNFKEKKEKKSHKKSHKKSKKDKSTRHQEALFGKKKDTPLSDDTPEKFEKSSGKSGNEEGLSVEETNKLRASLGLKPLKV